MGDALKGNVRFSKTSCYLCSEWLEDDEIEEHLFQCSRQSVACPDGCGAFVARQNLPSHRHRCAQGFGEAAEANTTTTHHHETVDARLGMESNVDAPTLQEQVHMLAEELQLMRLTVGEELHQRAELMAQLGHLKRRSELADRWTEKVNDALVSFNKLVKHESTRRGVDVSGLEQRQSHLELWRVDLTTRFNTIESRSHSSAESEPPYPEVHALQRQLDRVERELKRLQAAPPPPPSGAVVAKPPDSEQPVGMAQHGALQAMVEDVRERQAKHGRRLQDALQQAFEGEERVGRMAKQLERYRRETYYTKQRLDALQANLQLEEKLSAFSSGDGRVIWRIDEFEKRFLESKEHDTMLKGPTFTNQPYGYVLQLEVSLYGIGTWRGRNLIAGLTILKGSYDALLPWPCQLTGTIRLRDQPDQRPAAMDLCKPIVAKRKGQQTDQHQFVYVPHEVLRSRQFLRDDTLFLEVILDRTERGTNERSIE